MNFLIISTTSKKSNDSIRLPDRKILESYHKNFLINTKKDLLKLLKNYQKNDLYILADCESKQGLSVYNELIENYPNVIDYKPNDLTMEAADLAILNYFNLDLNDKTIGIYGTGNIAFKLALRLSERNAKIHIFGKNNQKKLIFIKALKQITFEEDLIYSGSNNSRMDCFVSFVSADEVISSEYNSLLNSGSLCLDGGIGNFSKEFISMALKNGHDVRRVDVRQSQEIMDGYINSRLNSQFSEIIGRDVINNHSVVAGGIMGQDGQVIIDRIVNPTRVIGIANGIGGVKNESDLSTEEHIKIQEVQSYIEQNC